MNISVTRQRPQFQCTHFYLFCLVMNKNRIIKKKKKRFTMRGVSANKPPMAASKCRLHITTTIKLKKSKEHLLDSFQVKKFANRKIYANKYPLISSIHSCSVWFLFACFLFGWMEALLMEMLLAVASLVFQ